MVLKLFREHNNATNTLNKEEDIIKILLLDGEQIICSSKKPRFWPYFSHRIQDIVIPLIMGGLIIWITKNAKAEYNLLGENVWLVSFFPICWAIIVSIKKILSFHKTYYYITNNRVFLFEGIFTPKLNTIDFTQITKISMKKSLLQNDVGSIFLYNGRKKFQDDSYIDLYDGIIGVENVFELFHQVCALHEKKMFSNS